MTNNNCITSIRFSKKLVVFQYLTIENCCLLFESTLAIWKGNFSSCFKRKRWANKWHTQLFFIFRMWLFHWFSYFPQPMLPKKNLLNWRKQSHLNLTVKQYKVCSDFGSSEPLAHGELLWSLDVRRPSCVVNNCFKRHLLLNNWLDFYKTWQKLFLYGPL